jgi:SAM-dependent methyltransferase
MGGVADFYERFPFPGYERLDNPAALVEKARRSRFAAEIERWIPPDARVLDLGCGTGQLAIFLALGRRVVIGADLSGASLALGAEFARRFGVSGVRFVRMDLLRRALRAGAFDVVIANGVLHHLPEPREGFRRAVELVRRGGHIVVGLYHRIGRIPTRLRGLLVRRAPRRLAFLDPRVRRDELTGDRRSAWISDQYFHPLERRHTAGEVLEWFREAGVERVASFPSFPERPRVARWIREVGWFARLGREGGLFVTIGRRAR